MSNNEEENYYNVLGVSNTASSDEIKKAYRKLSLMYHPDKSVGNEDKFKTVSNAYSVLSDPERRNQYDMRLRMGIGMMPDGMNMFGGDRTHHTFTHVGPEDIFNMFNGGVGSHPFMNIFEMMNNMHSKTTQGMPENIRIFRTGGMGNGGVAPQDIFESLYEEKPPQIVKQVTIKLEQILEDLSIPVEVERFVIENGVKVYEKEVLYVNIPKGIDNGEFIILHNKGNQTSRNKSDVKIIINITNNSEFEREGLNLIYKKNITLKESLCGFNFYIKHLNGVVYNITNTSETVTLPNYKKIISNMGLTRDTYVGNLIIEFFIQFPTSLPKEIIEKLKDLL